MTLPVLKGGDAAPDFSLPGVDGKTYHLRSFAERPVLVVLFSCNHCTYVQAYEDRLIEIQRDYGDRGVQLVAINSNDDVNYPEDSFENMVKRAKLKGYNFPYLRDAEAMAPRIPRICSSLTAIAACATRGRSTTTGNAQMLSHAGTFERRWRLFSETANRRNPRRMLLAAPSSGRIESSSRAHRTFSYQLTPPPQFAIELPLPLPQQIRRAHS